MKKEFSMVIVAKHLFDGHRFWKDGGYVCIDAVSYTHLTLPTIA